MGLFDFVSDIFDPIKDAVGGIYNGILKPVIEPVYNGVIKPVVGFGERVVNKGANIAENLASGAEGLSGGLANFFNTPYALYIVLAIGGVVAWKVLDARTSVAKAAVGR